MGRERLQTGETPVSVMEMGPYTMVSSLPIPEPSLREGKNNREGFNFQYTYGLAREILDLQEPENRAAVYLINFITRSVVHKL